MDNKLNKQSPSNKGRKNYLICRIGSVKKRRGKFKMILGGNFSMLTFLYIFRYSARNLPLYPECGYSSLEGPYKCTNKNIVSLAVKESFITSFML